MARPRGYKTAVVEGDDAYRARRRGGPLLLGRARAAIRSVVLYSGEEAAFAMPAAAWAARSGDAALPVERDSVPAPRAALREHGKPNVYVLGPERAVSNKVVARSGRAGEHGRPHLRARPPWSTRSRSPATARGTSAGAWRCRATTSPWRTRRGPWTRPPPRRWPAAGVFAPLLLTDQAADLPRALESYLLSVQPGYELDPGQAVYNRVWILGDEDALSLDAQARLDRITELIPVQATAP